MSAFDLKDQSPEFEGYDTDDGTPERPRRAGGVVLALAAAAVTLVCGLALIFDATWPAPVASPEDCAAIVDGDARLNCYDTAVHRMPPQPARGAAAVVD
jgi:hypothetical protein